MSASPVVIVAILSFLLGSIPFGYLLVRIFRGVDVRKTGSGNIGATNVARTGSKRLAIATLLLDAFKGFAAVAIAFAITHQPLAPRVTLLDGPDAYTVLQRAYCLAALAGVCAVLGHMFTPWLGFKGGKGVATAMGAFAALVPMAVLVVLVLFIIIVAVTRYVSLGSILGALVFPFAAWWLNPFTRNVTVMPLIIATSLLVIVRHKDNIRRLMAGNENRFGTKAKTA